MKIGDEFKDEAGNILRVVSVATKRLKLGQRVRKDNINHFVIHTGTGYGLLSSMNYIAGYIWNSLDALSNYVYQNLDKFTVLDS